MLRQVTHDRAPVRIMWTGRGWLDLQSPTLATLLEIITDARNPKFFVVTKKSILKRFSQNLANKKLANIKGAWPDLDHKLQAIHFSRNETEMRQQRRGAPASNTARSRSNRMRREDSTSAFPLRHRNRTNTTLRLFPRYCKRECPRKALFGWSRSSGTRNAHTCGRGQRRVAIVGRGQGWQFAVHMEQDSVPKHIIVRSFRFEFRKEMLHDLVRHNTMVFARVTRS